VRLEGLGELKNRKSAEQETSVQQALSSKRRFIYGLSAITQKTTNFVTTDVKISKPTYPTFIYLFFPSSASPTFVTVEHVMCSALHESQYNL
jgi:hypothetical protein